VRSLDAIPFTTSFRFDMEVWHWAECDVAYAATSHLYARPGPQHDHAPQRDEVARGPIDPLPLPPPRKIEGAIEAETMRILARSAGLAAVRQGGFDPGLWSEERQLWVRGQRAGDFLEFEVPVPGSGPRRVLVYATRSWDYAIVRFLVNGQVAGPDQDLFNSAGRAVVATGPIDLGVFSPRDGRFILRLEVAGSNPRSEAPGTYLGLDCVVLAEP
jgi:hypothetical protein